MEIDGSHHEKNTKGLGKIMTEEEQPAPKACNKMDKMGDNDENNNSDSDSSSMACPLFMEGLPRNFATNPQLAAIASLLDDEVREETKENSAEAEHESTRENNNNKLPSRQSRAQSPQTTSRHLKKFGKVRNNRRRQRASPYPRPQDRTNERATKKTSVGEITLFMNMWKP